MPAFNPHPRPFHLDTRRDRPSPALPHIPACFLRDATPVEGGLLMNGQARFAAMGLSGQIRRSIKLPIPSDVLPPKALKALEDFLSSLKGHGL